MRMSRAILVVLGFIAAFAAGRISRAPPPPPPGSNGFDAARHEKGVDRIRAIWSLGRMPASIVMLGDSLTATPPWNELSGCPSMANRGIYSDTLASLHRRLHDVVAQRPRAVVLLIGTNDVRQGRSPEDVAAAMRTIVARLLEAGIAVYRIPILPVGATDRSDPKAANVRIARANEAIDAGLAGLDAGKLELGPLLTGADGLLRPDLTSDGLHLTADGYAIWRDLLAPVVAKHCVVGSERRP